MLVGQCSLPTMLALGAGTQSGQTAATQAQEGRCSRWQWQQADAKPHTHSSAWMESEGAT